MSLKPARLTNEVTLDDLAARVQRLEAVSPPSGSGIQFDVDNTGDWLNITTTGEEGSFPSPSWGIDIEDTGGGGIYLLSSDGITLEASGDGGLNFNADNGTDGGINLNDKGSGGVNIEAADGGFNFVIAAASAGGIVIKLDTPNSSGTISILGLDQGINIETGPGSGGDIRITPDGHLLLYGLPTSTSGLGTGTLWNNGGIVNVV